jgi:hypothetical protein
MTPDFRSGMFFEVQMLSDARFFAFTSFCTGTSAADLENNVRALGELQHAGPDQSLAAPLRCSVGVRPVAIAMTIETLLIEGAVAVAFLMCPISRLAMKIRNWLLLFFVVSTYSVATVIGFGWLLVIMGFSQCERDERHSRTTYAAAFVLLQTFTVPWRSVIDHLLGRGME